MINLRVRCVDDGCELLVERHGANEHSIQVAELKEIVLQQRRQLSDCKRVITPTNTQPLNLEDCFVLFRGQILADPDVVDLNSLSATDFFVFAPDIQQRDFNSHSRHEAHKDLATFELLRSQLVDMGFSAALAAHALQQSSNNLSDAVAMLIEGQVEKKDHRMEIDDKTETTTDVGIQHHPSIFPLQSLLNDKKMDKLRELAATDSFQALLMLEQNFSSEMLHQLNENPVATLRLLSAPAIDSSIVTADNELKIDDAIDSNDAKYGIVANTVPNDAINRLVAMGFPSDVVEMMYESCGGDEHLTANALLQTLEP
ncbi:uncharacterized protein CCR75_009582 [Bremia lactucae]|uniref:UBA domain-containing protein n=1 Tax=Bremia lactucae TaxID=4779 RepID=A0A976FJU9_BRELC|nr:hypothetical protein CCR75_006440 [Bremia lactucae]TDH68148.1 hypothetical protein CCR75_009570 [Bremia lactucae]TDH68154.1 hypothetical protein CCR75_009582 [Bremia lactucae]